MNMSIKKLLPDEESEADRRRGLLAEDALSLDLVSAYAGDRSLTHAENNLLAEVKKNRGLRFFSDLLYAVTHQYFAPEVAEQLWTGVVKHKYTLSKLLGRDVRIVVAALDYLSNITTNMGSATLVGEAHIEEIVGLSLRDGLTGLFNHSYFYQQVELEVKRFVRYGTPVSLVLIDIDDFKLVNDTFGHLAGDYVLREVAELLQKSMRKSDTTARYGGEEFAILLPETPQEGAFILAERLRDKLASMTFNYGEQTIFATMSIGIAEYSPKTDSSNADLIKKADRALYRAKESGRNQCCLHSSE